MTFTQGLIENIKIKSRKLIRNGEIRTFIENLGIVFIFRFTSAVLSVIGLVLAARYLGAVSVGNITMMQNTAYLLYIPMCFGINLSIIKFLPDCNNKEENEKLLGSIGVWSLVLTVVSIVVYWVFHSFINTALGFSATQLLLTVIMAVTINYSMITEAILRSRKRFLTLGIIKMASSLIFFAFTLVSSLVLKNYYYFVYGIILNQLVVIIWSLKTIKIKKFRFSMKTSKLAYKYGAINMVSGVLSYIMFSSDLYIVNHFCSAYDVGIYSLYQVNVKNFFNLMFHEIFAVVFLPTIVQMNTMKIYKRIKSLIPIILPIAIIANMTISICLVLLYGRSYTINWIYILLISVSLGFHFLYYVFNSVFTVEGKNGALLCMTVLGLPMPVLILISIVLTRTWGINGQLISLLVTQLTLVGVFLFIIKFKYLKNKQTYINILK
ncbi:lipopolysaccharide biosynthesis protein [Ruminiclostridium cellulolyticum]|uniref:Polysaccharide biosynthesis protein n=1 Tax=Ruminiclostridium cellulolyticum (strain ATCC 35319 / DSM 5812 / JCM 6584 / H10) TaxID=394503 RepID=B8I324_RUMCH|nr:oligosaccharide flippase family protein [Ruminiclostridium cellulolyticum]ACL76167.1 polysaccharide biosynthesis protein [Ruminiclostridium cellulolyticum H10]